MAPKKTDKADGTKAVTLTDSELRFLRAVFDNMTQKPDADWDAVASAMSLKDAKCAKERWRQMSVRHGWRENPNAANGTSPRKPSGGVAKKPRTPRKKLPTRADEDADVKSEDEDDTKLSKLPESEEHEI